MAGARVHIRALPRSPKRVGASALVLAVSLTFAELFVLSSVKSDGAKLATLKSKLVGLVFSALVSPASPPSVVAGVASERVA